MVYGAYLNMNINKVDTTKQ